ncbi:MAG: carbon-nitrogen hydrolase family protein [Anaerolineae bacterium]
MPRIVHVAALQLPPPGGATAAEMKSSNLANAIAYVDEAGHRGCDIACLPETFDTYGLALDRPDSEWQSVPGEVTDLLAAKARQYGMYVIAPIAALIGGVRRNTAVIIDRDGGIAGQYFKTHLTQPELDAGLIAGDDLPVFTLDFGRIGIMTCLDNSFPETARVLAVKGAEMIFFPHVQSGYGEVGWVAQLVSRAIDSAVYLVPVAFGMGPDDPWMPGTIMGRSGVIGRDGLTLASTGRQAGVASATIDLDQPRWVRCFGVIDKANYGEEAMARRRPDLYGALAQPTIDQ